MPTLTAVPRPNLVRLLAALATLILLAYASPVSPQRKTAKSPRRPMTPVSSPYPGCEEVEDGVYDCGYSEEDPPPNCSQDQDGRVTCYRGPICTGDYPSSTCPEDTATEATRATGAEGAGAGGGSQSRATTASGSGQDSSSVLPEGASAGVVSARNVALARTGSEAWILALLGGLSLAGGAGLLAGRWLRA